MKMYRCSLLEVTEPGLNMKHGGNSAVITGVEDQLLRAIDAQFAEWEDEAQLRNSISKVEQKLARTIGAMVQSGMHLDDPMDVEYDGAKGEASFHLDTPDGVIEIVIKIGER